jgi:5-methylcytosine-specific restriction endonuclease McrA
MATPRHVTLHAYCADLSDDATGAASPAVSASGSMTGTADTKPRGELLRVCRCGKLIPATRRRCPTCDRADSTRRRNKPSGQVYADKRWRKTRKTVLDRDEHTCVVCGAHATHVDHRPPITVLLARGDSPFDAAYCRACCASCAGRADAARAHTRGAPLPLRNASGM